MFFPRFSTRSLLALMGIAAVGFFVLGMAVDGYVLAGAMSAVIVAGVVVAGVHATLFALVWALSQALVRIETQRGGTDDPFAKEAYPLPVPSLAQRLGQGTVAPMNDTPQPGQEGNVRDGAVDDSTVDDKSHD